MMKKGVLFLALLLVVSFGGCTNDNEDLEDVLALGTWKVGYINEGDDERTSLFYGYVFTFLPNGTVTVDRPIIGQAPGTWNEHDSDRRLELDFGKSGLLEKLNDDWVVDYVEDSEVGMHEPGVPFNQLRLNQR